MTQLAFSTEGTQLATASEDGVSIWNTTTGEELFAIQEAGNIMRVAFSPDDKLLATGGPDGMVAIWDAETGRQILSLFGHTRPIFGIGFTPDGLRLATASGDETVKIWDIETGEELLTLVGHTGRVHGLAITLDGSRLVTAGEDGISRIYLLKTDELVKLARSRLTRSLTTEECQKYLHVEECPVSP